MLAGGACGEGQQIHNIRVKIYLQRKLPRNTVYRFEEFVLELNIYVFAAIKVTFVQAKRYYSLCLLTLHTLHMCFQPIHLYGSLIKGNERVAQEKKELFRNFVPEALIPTKEFIL